MSALPKSVKRQIEAAEKAHAEAYKKEEEPKPEVVEGKKDEEGTDFEKPKEATAEVQPQAAAETGAELGDEGKPAEPALSLDAQPAEDPRWEQRYNILKGKYNAEVPRLQSELKALRAEMEGMRNVLAKMDEQKSAAPTSPAAPAAPQGRLLKEEEIEDYGTEMIDVIHRGAQEVFNPELQAMRDEIKQLREQLGGMGQTLNSGKRENVLDTLTKEVPDWKTLNEDELFLHWLDQKDAFSGLPRQELLDRAFEDADAARVVTFFKSYLEENAALQPPQGAETPQPRNTSTKLDDMVAPGKPKAAPGSAQKGEKRTWTQRQIADFYRKVNAGKYRTRPEEQMKIERDIVAAGREGRITA